MVEILVATNNDVAELVESVGKLFVADAGQFDEFADTTWPDREGLASYGSMVKDSGALLLVARSGRVVVGHLVGLTSPPTATRQDVSFAVLQSIYVDETLRGQGIGSRMCSSFLAWAKEAGCVQATVSAYTKNERANVFYAERGFAPQSQTSVLRL